MSQLTDYQENKVVDALYRGQALGAAASNFFGLFTAAPGETGGGTETTYTGYTRVTLLASLTNFSGTQSAGSTAASSGTGGQISNNVAITFGAPTSGPVTITHFGRFDAVTAGNLLEYGTLTASRTLNNGDSAPAFAIAAYTVTVA